MLHGIVFFLYYYYQKLQQEVLTICNTVTTGRFLDASQKPTAILLDMMQVSFAILVGLLSFSLITMLAAF
jgi:hypothetical protein